MRRLSRSRRLTGEAGFDVQSSRLSPLSFDPIGESVHPLGSRMLWINLGMISMKKPEQIRLINLSLSR